MIKGKALKYGDDVNTDVIFPGRYLALTEPEEIAAHAMEDLDPDFLKKLERGDIIVAGKNFGCGSSREQAAIALKYAGVGAIVAKSFARIFYRNAINQGIPVVECPEGAEAIEDGDEIEIDLDNGVLVDKSTGETFNFKPLPEFIQNILSKGGLLPFLKQLLKTR
ncbi:MAG TPA: 3-isopropylmalate dehydratase small subunit [Thermoplasmatales archaeon]|nr:MAG: 3-isopropylmalate dehydratase [Thermoplasmata archaeon]HDM25328.1 3-isopropylmalate dehydratase small subunit [Thermoplasmatales archaeon]